MQKNNPDERILIVAPVGQDARVMADLLAERGFETQICAGTEHWCAEVNAGALVLTEEALEMSDAADLLEALKTQPPWSELPVIILTTGGQSRLARLLDSVAVAAGSVTLLERPIAITTLMRSVEVALNSRRRQYQVRDLLEEQRRRRTELERAKETLRQAHEQLADRARHLETLVELRTATLAESNKELRREMAERQEAEAAREVLRRQLLVAQEEERRRIARELHDQMGQNLTALNIGLKSLADTEPFSESRRSLVQPLRELAAQTARDLHRVAWSLRPAALDDFGLVKAIRNLVGTWSAQCGIEIDLEAEKYESDGISSEIETTVYRVIQEALNNIAKHSGAKRVGLVVRRAANHLQVIIEDDGCGFDVTNASSRTDGRGGLGLLGIQERLGVLSGSLNVESSPQRGATLIIRIPFSKGT